MSRITDPTAFGRVAVVMGGDSSEREVSLNSGSNVLAALRARGVDATPVDGIPALLAHIREGRCDRVFNILHGRGQLQLHGAIFDVTKGLLKTL